MRHVIVLSFCLVLIACVSPPNIPQGSHKYKTGYLQGCNSGYRAAGNPYHEFQKDTYLYSTENQYHQGWNDGFVVCKGQYDNILRSLS